MKDICERFKLRFYYALLLSLLIGIAGLILLKPSDSLLYSGDDDDYFAVASSIAYGKFPYFSDEYHAGEKMPFASVGPGALASPFVFTFSLIDRAQHNDITIKRNKDNRYWSWSLLGFHFAGYFYFLLATVSLYEMLRLWSTNFSAFITTGLVTFGGGGILIYVFKRPVMSHVFEYFSISISMLLLSLALKERHIRHHAAWVGICAAFVLLTRYNNAPLSLGFIATFFYALYKQKNGPIRSQQLWVFAFFATPIAVFRLLPVLANGYSAYDQGYGGAISKLSPMINPMFYWIRLGEIIFGVDMGLIFTAPALLMAILCMCLFWRKAPREFLFLSSFAVINIYLAIVWRSFGSFYGYRYVVFTATPLLSIYLALAIDRLKDRLGKAPAILLAVIILPLPILSMAVYGINSKYSFDMVINNYGVATYTQPNYHESLILELVNDPLLLIHQLTENFLASASLTSATSEHLLQRALLYALPPLLALLLYWFIGYRIESMSSQKFKQTRQ